MDSPKDQYLKTVVPANNIATLLESGNSVKNGDMCNLKHEIISPKFNELIIKIEIKGDTSLNLKKHNNNIQIYIKCY